MKLQGGMTVERRAELRGLPVVILRERSDRENLVDSEKI